MQTHTQLLRGTLSINRQYYKFTTHRKMVESLEITLRRNVLHLHRFDDDFCAFMSIIQRYTMESL